MCMGSVTLISLQNVQKELILMRKNDTLSLSAISVIYLRYNAACHSKTIGKGNTAVI